MSPAEPLPPGVRASMGGGKGIEDWKGKGKSAGTTAAGGKPVATGDGKGKGKVSYSGGKPGKPVSEVDTKGCEKGTPFEKGFGSVGMLKGGAQSTPAATGTPAAIPLPSQVVSLEAEQKAMAELEALSEEQFDQEVQKAKGHRLFQKYYDLMLEELGVEPEEWEFAEEEPALDMAGWLQWIRFVETGNAKGCKGKVAEKGSSTSTPAAKGKTKGKVAEKGLGASTPAAKGDTTGKAAWKGSVLSSPKGFGKCKTMPVSKGDGKAETASKGEVQSWPTPPPVVVEPQGEGGAAVENALPAVEPQGEGGRAAALPTPPPVEPQGKGGGAAVQHVMQTPPPGGAAVENAFTPPPELFLNGFRTLTDADLQKPAIEVIDFYESQAKQWVRQVSDTHRAALVRVAASHALFPKFAETKMEHGGKFGDGSEDLAVFEAWLVKMALAEKLRSYDSSAELRPLHPVKRSAPDQSEDMAYQEYWKQFARARHDASPAKSSGCAGTEVGSNATPSPACRELNFEGRSNLMCCCSSFRVGETPDPLPRLDSTHTHMSQMRQAGHLAEVHQHAE